MHLAGLETRDEWEQFEKQWQHFVGKSKHFRKEVGPAFVEVNSALSSLADEIKASYIKDQKGIINLFFNKT